MTGLGIRIYTDENVDPKVAEQLRVHGYDALSCQEAGNHNQGLDDEWQLTFATAGQRAIVTHNVTDFVELELAWKESGRIHAGIICVVDQYTIGEFLRAIRRHLDAYGPEIQHDLLMWV